MRKYLDNPIYEYSRLKITEGELETAQTVLASKDLVDRLQDIVQNVGKMVNDDLPSVVEAVRASFGNEASQRYSTSANEALNSLLETVKEKKSDLENATLVLTGDAESETEDHELDIPDSYDEEPEPESGPESESDSEPEPESEPSAKDKETTNPAGRDFRESVDYKRKRLKKLRESIQYASGQKAYYISEAIKKLSGEIHEEESKARKISKRIKEHEKKAEEHRKKSRQLKESNPRESKKHIDAACKHYQTATAMKRGENVLEESIEAFEISRDLK